MRVLPPLGLCVLASAIPAAAQSPCPSSALAGAATAVTTVRHQLHTAAVPASSPAVPPAIAGQLGQLKDALASAADAAFSCANGTATAEQLQASLTQALHLHPADAADTAETRKGQDVGAYGSDLAVQVFQLFGRPKFMEVDFHYGVECGDDHLLMVFEAPSDNAGSVWRERLRWSAPSYSNVGDALGDFVLLTPLTGSYKSPTWRFVVAAGHPGCARSPRPSHFDLVLLSPTGDPAKPAVDWHFDHAYIEDHVTPRLATTEDTLDFRIVHPARGGKPAPPAEEYRFHLNSDGHLEPAPAGEGDPSAATPVEAPPEAPGRPQ